MLPRVSGTGTVLVLTYLYMHLHAWLLVSVPVLNDTRPLAAPLFTLKNAMHSQYISRFSIGFCVSGSFHMLHSLLTALLCKRPHTALVFVEI